MRVCIFLPLPDTVLCELFDGPWSSQGLYHAGAGQVGALVCEQLCGVYARHHPNDAAAGRKAEGVLRFTCWSYMSLAILLHFLCGALAGMACGSKLWPYGAVAVLCQRLVWQAAGSMLRSCTIHVRMGDAYLMLRAYLPWAVLYAIFCGPEGMCLGKLVASLARWFGGSELPAGRPSRKAFEDDSREHHPYYYSIQCSQRVRSLLVQASWFCFFVIIACGVLRSVGVFVFVPLSSVSPGAVCHTWVCVGLPGRLAESLRPFAGVFAPAEWPAFSFRSLSVEVCTYLALGPCFWLESGSLIQWLVGTLINASVGAGTTVGYHCAGCNAVIVLANRAGVGSSGQVGELNAPRCSVDACFALAIVQFLVWALGLRPWLAS